MNLIFWGFREGLRPKKTKKLGRVTLTIHLGTNAHFESWHEILEFAKHWAHWECLVHLINKAKSFFFNRTGSKTFNKKYQDSSGPATKASPDQAKNESLIIYKQD